MAVVAYTFSLDGVKIYLRAKTWAHVVEEHDEMAGNMDLVLDVINAPDYILKGTAGEKVAVKFFEKTSLGPKYVVVPYREISVDEGFIITAYMMSKQRFNRFVKGRETLWRRQ